MSEKTRTIDSRDTSAKTVSVTITPANATYSELVWSSENEKVATVKNGQVKPVGEGKTVIKATSRDGGFTASMIVLVAKGQMDSVDLTLPGKTRIVGRAAFAGLPVKTVRCPDGMTTIEAEAFKGCKKLKQIYIPKSVTKINKTAFKSCPMVTIFGEKGSVAQTFAETNELPFFPLTLK